MNVHCNPTSWAQDWKTRTPLNKILIFNVWLKNQPEGGGLSSSTNNCTEVIEIFLCGILVENFLECSSEHRAQAQHKIDNLS